MRDSSVVYVNEALCYYFSFICTFIFDFFHFFFFFDGFKVGTFDIASTHNKSAYNLSDLYVHLNQTNQASVLLN